MDFDTANYRKTRLPLWCAFIFSASKAKAAGKSVLPSNAHLPVKWAPQAVASRIAVVTTPSGSLPGERKEKEEGLADES